MLRTVYQQHFVVVHQPVLAQELLLRSWDVVVQLVNQEAQELLVARQLVELLCVRQLHELVVLCCVREQLHRIVLQLAQQRRVLNYEVLDLFLQALTIAVNHVRSEIRLLVVELLRCQVSSFLYSASLLLDYCCRLLGVLGGAHQQLRQRVASFCDDSLKMLVLACQLLCPLHELLVLQHAAWLLQRVAQDQQTSVRNRVQRVSVRHSGIVDVEPRLRWVVTERKLRLDHVVVQLRMRTELEWKVAINGHLQVQSLEILRGVELFEVLNGHLHDLL